jgi:hypothetical protein
MASTGLETCNSHDYEIAYNASVGCPGCDLQMIIDEKNEEIERLEAQIEDNGVRALQEKIDELELKLQQYSKDD